MTGLQKLSKELMGERCLRVLASGLRACAAVKQDKQDVRIYHLSIDRLSTRRQPGSAIGFAM